MRLRPVCWSCVSFDVEGNVDGVPAEAELFACFECQDVFYFMPDARPRVRQLTISELYMEPSVSGTRGRVAL